MALLLFLFLSNNFKKIYLAFAITGLLAIIRYEGLLMIIPISVVFFIRFRKQKKDLIKFIICISIFILILAPMAYLKNETMGQDGFVSHIAVGVDIQSPIWTPADLLNPGSINLIKYVGWAQIPSFIIFVPLGIIFIFKSLDYKKITIILSIFIMLIPAFYGYSRGYEEIKYLYVLYPIFCVLACFAFKIFLEKFHRRNLIFCIIIGGIILSSIIFVEWKAMDNEHYLEAYEILAEIGQKEMKINKEFGKSDGEFFFIHWVMIETAEKFPILQKELPPGKIKYATITAITQDQANPDAILHLDLYNLRDYFQFLEKQKITHLILDKYSGAQLQHELSLNLLDIFNHENKYPFLIKEYDSKENGFNYHLKLFKIDYDLYNEWINEN
jgi:hypothetical protein